MQGNGFLSVLQGAFPFELTSGQADAVGQLASFVTSNHAQQAFVLTGFAGTGKTSVIGTLVKCLPAIHQKSVLLAPTGRAAKVLSLVSRKPAFTIHKKIYRRASDADGLLYFSLSENLHTNTIFIVDEASMIPDGSGLLNQSSLLDDLIQYVYSGVNCKLIFVGDTAQLPPVGLAVSPALHLDYMRQRFSLDMHHVRLSEVMRQASYSGILYNATKLRVQMQQRDWTYPQFELRDYEDIKRANGQDLEELLNHLYSKYSMEEVMIITRSNKRANLFNGQIRARVRYFENEVAAGDYLMVVKNNYHWLPGGGATGFIANGDMVEVLKTGSEVNEYGFRFMQATIRLCDFPDEPNLEVKLLLDTLASEAPALSQEDDKRLYQNVSLAYEHVATKKERREFMRQDPYFNALQVKYGNAVTCHKAQGGQWDAVLIDVGYFTWDMLDAGFFRWLYTAVTRAKQELYLVNFPDEFFFEEQS